MNEIEKIPLICRYCGLSFRRNRNRPIKNNNFCSHQCFLNYNRGKNNVLWKGQSRNNQGRLRIKQPDHPNADRNGFISNYVLIAENFYMLEKEL